MTTIFTTRASVTGGADSIDGGDGSDIIFGGSGSDASLAVQVWTAYLVVTAK